MVRKNILLEQGQVLTLLLLLVLMDSLDLGNTSWAQEQAVRQGSLTAMDNQTQNQLDMIVKLLQEQKEGGIVHTFLTVIVFMMGLAGFRDIRVVHRSGAPSFYPYEKALPSSLLRAHSSCHDNSDTSYTGHSIIRSDG